MKKFHISVSVEDFEESLSNYSSLLSAEPLVIVPNRYAMWKTDLLNFTISKKEGQGGGTIRHIGFEQEGYERIFEHRDNNNITWEFFSQKAQIEEIKKRWPDAKFYQPIENPVISLIVPIYNEEENLEHFFARTIPILLEITDNWEIICINDGSKDNSAKEIIKYHEKDSRIKLIDLSRNFGKEAAMTAGIHHATGDAIIPIDVDLQDPPELIKEMVEKWQEGYQMVIATRNSRDSDSFFKKFTANGFYYICNKMLKVNIPPNTGDFRLMDRKIVEVLKEMPEKIRFMKGIFSWPGFSSTQIFFERKARYKGETSWNYWKLWQFALDGIFSFTSLPLKIWTYIGASISLFTLFYSLFLVIRTMVFGVDIPGYASLMSAVLFIGGIQLISLGVIGEYIARIYQETKNRPIYVVKDKYGL